jgi:UDP-galactopyranose mutase
MRDGNYDRAPEDVVDTDESYDCIVVGGGIAGLSFSWKAASAGRRVVVLERERRVGGCIHTHRMPGGFWHELGAHSVYNSYGAFLDLLVGTGARAKIVPRGPARARFGLLRNGTITWLTPPKVLLQLDWLEASAHLPFGLLAARRDETMRAHYARLVGRGNYDRVLAPFLAAVPSQRADDFPVAGPGSLFKKRPRRKEFPRSFSLAGGLQTVCDAVAGFPGVAVESGVAAARVARRGSGFSVATADGRTLEAPVVAVAAPTEAAAEVLRVEFGAVAAAISRVRSVAVESMGVVLPRARCWMPDCAFVVPAEDVFFSCVTRDPVPDPEWRGFAFHFRPGVARDEKLARMAALLRVEAGELVGAAEQRVVLPSPALGHAAVVRDIDAALAPGNLALNGNYFGGLAIED